MYVLRRHRIIVLIDIFILLLPTVSCYQPLVTITSPNHIFCQQSSSYSIVSYINNKNKVLDLSKQNVMTSRYNGICRFARNDKRSNFDDDDDHADDNVDGKENMNEINVDDDSIVRAPPTIKGIPAATENDKTAVDVVSSMNNQQCNEMTELYYRRDINLRPDNNIVPPIYNLRKESILFDANSSTRYNNNLVRIWEFCENNLPRIIHGSRRHNNKTNSRCRFTMNRIVEYFSSPETDANIQDTVKSENNRNSDYDDTPTKSSSASDEPIALLYNMIFVRIPIILTGIFYLYNLLYLSHPLICDIGYGSFEINPIIVLSVLYILLL